eukprot:scaffold45487_cov43-Phaeocystis_antarctica.AAC.4
MHLHLLKVRAERPTAAVQGGQQGRQGWGAGRDAPLPTLDPNPNPNPSPNPSPNQAEIRPFLLEPIEEIKISWAEYPGASRCASFPFPAEAEPPSPS